MALITLRAVEEPSGQYVGYVSDPNGRGTASLVISCLLTLLLCVWSALHLNVPGPGKSIRRWLWLNIRWIIAGIYLPEMVVFAAWRQWSSARLLQNYIDSLQFEELTKSGSSSGRKRCNWTMAHSFFACSGGFAIELECLRDAMPTSTQIESAPLQRLTITARGMMMLARIGQLPCVEKEEIEDKSKANNLAKAAVIIQAAWMLLQVVGRLIAKMPVTLLEVNTVAHVSCTFVMYLFWWSKPLLPNEPIVLRDEALAPVAAFMYASSEISGHINRKNIKSQTTVKTLFAHLNIFSSIPEIETLCLRPSDEDRLEENQRYEFITAPELARYDVSNTKMSAYTASCEKPYRIFKAPKSCSHEVEAHREKTQSTAFFERRPRIVYTDDTSNRATKEEEQRWTLIEQALRKHTWLFTERIAIVHEVDKLRCIHLHSEQLVSTHVRNWPSDDLLRNVDGLVVGVVLWLANFCYGAFHAAGWNSHFPSYIEQLLWRVSASYIGFCGGLWILLNWTVARSKRLNAFWEKWMDGAKGPVQSFVIGIIVFICGLSLMLARIYVVVEAFVSIRQLPVAAYDTPQWSNVFPHF